MSIYISWFRLPCGVLAFTRYCHCPFCMASIAIQDGRGGKLDCAIVLGIKGGNGVPKQGDVCES